MVIQYQLVSPEIIHIQVTPRLSTLYSCMYAHVYVYLCIGNKEKEDMNLRGARRGTWEGLEEGNYVLIF